MVKVVRTPDFYREELWRERDFVMPISRKARRAKNRELKKKRRKKERSTETTVLESAPEIDPMSRGEKL